MAFPSIANAEFTILLTYIPFELFLFILYFVAKIKKFHNFRKTVL